MDPVKFSIESQQVTRSSPDRVLGLILDPVSWPSWQPEIVTTRSPRGADGAVEGRARLLGFVVEGRSTPVSVGEAHFEEDVVVGVRMRVRYEVRPTSTGGATIVRRLNADLPGGFSGRILSFFLKRRLERMQSKVLDELVAQSELA